MLAQTHNPTPLNFNADNLAASKTYSPTTLFFKEQYPTVIVGRDITVNPTHKFFQTDITHNPTPTNKVIGVDAVHDSSDVKHIEDTGPGPGISTSSPTEEASGEPSYSPSYLPTVDASVEPSSIIYIPTAEPTFGASGEATYSPTDLPTAEPTFEASGEATYSPTEFPTVEPTLEASVEPSNSSADLPTAEPTFGASGEATYSPTEFPTVEPTLEASGEPSNSSADLPTAEPTVEVSGEATYSPTDLPTSEPTFGASGEITDSPTYLPTAEPTLETSGEPSNSSAGLPTAEPTVEVSGEPSNSSADLPTAEPTVEEASREPSTSPTNFLTDIPTYEPSVGPSNSPTDNPTEIPTIEPSGEPSYNPTDFPTELPTPLPTYSYLVSVSQIVSGVSYDAYSSNIGTFEEVFGNSVVDSLDGAVSYSDVGFVGVSSVSTSQKYEASIYGSNSGVGVDYTIDTFGLTGYNSTTDAESSVGSMLQSAVSSGIFTSYFQSNAALMGAAFLANASSSAITISIPGQAPTPSPTNSDIAEISGITVGAIVLIAVFMIVVVPVLGIYCMSTTKVKQFVASPDESSSLIGKKKTPTSIFDAFGKTPEQGSTHPDLNLSPSILHKTEGLEHEQDAKSQDILSPATAPPGPPTKGPNAQGMTHAGADKV